MYAVGQVKMQGSEMHQGDDSVHARGNCEAGGFVLWQKNPDLWCLELVVAGFKVSAGSNGKIAWNQSSSQPNHAHRGPARPLRRFFQVTHHLCCVKSEMHKKNFFKNIRNGNTRQHMNMKNINFFYKYQIL